MSEEIDKLRQVGVQKIYEKTHIPLGFIRSILDEDFDVFTKIQFSGFISIIEREYAFDLSSLRERGLAYLGEIEEKVSDSGVFVEPKRKKNFTKLYLLLAVVIFIIALVLTLQDSETAEAKIQPKIDDTLIHNVQKTIKPLQIKTTEETNSSKIIVDIKEPSIELNTTKEVEVPIVKETVKEKKVKQSLVIRAKSQVWIGYINVKTGQKYSKILKGKLSLKAEKHWIFSFGHPYVKIAVNGKVQRFKSSTGKLYEYKNNKIKMITRKEFKKLNRGRLW